MKKVRQSCFKHPKVYGESNLLDIHNILMHLKNNQKHDIRIIPTTLYFFYTLHTFKTGEVVKVYWRYLQPRFKRETLFPYPSINLLIRLKMENYLELINCEMVKGMEDILIEQKFDVMQTELLRYQTTKNRVDWEVELKDTIKVMVQKYLQENKVKKGA